MEYITDALGFIPVDEAHTTDTDNPHNVNKAQVGLGNVDNTNDKDRPISDLTQAALDTKAAEIDGIKDEINAHLAESVQDDVHGISDALREYLKPITGNTTGGETTFTLSYREYIYYLH